ncbi:MAG: CDP-alcohol phosphatidyltransferase family protein [Anaerolineae bacterium]|jgi:CDP-diacylglycerol--glycerol-3-phosphate 3-phosphatidyltransferase|nr:CDP-alcohol phosphatidyltransferase family protein [Anaerolineae bacterium]
MITFTQRLRNLTRDIIDPIGRTLNFIGVSPDAISLFGLFVVFLGAWRIALGEWTQAVAILLLGLPLDALDGATARAHGKFRPFGSFLDSTLDRYADAFLVGAIAIYYINHGQGLLAVFVIIALHGSLLVSYVRAKADAIRVNNEVGLFTRVERLLLMLIAWLGSLLFGQAAIDLGMIVLAIGTQVTVLQRLYHVYRALQHDQPRPIDLKVE